MSAKETTTKAPFNFEEEAKKYPKPREFWPALEKMMIEPKFKITSDEIVTSDTDPKKKLRRVEAEFYSQEVVGKKWKHKCVIFIPEDYKEKLTPERKGKVVIHGVDNVAFPVHVTKLGDPIATRLGYPTMILANPGYYEDGQYIEHHIRRLRKLREKTGKIYYNMYCQLAVVYVQAMNVFQDLLKLDELHAVIGGHSKRANSVAVAAANDPRIASAIFMGNEGVYPMDRISKYMSVHYAFFQDQLNIPMFYLGATNEDGYQMFNITEIQRRMKKPLTIEIIPNYCHAVLSDIQFMDYMMWVAHVFDDRPITQIKEVTHTRQGNSSKFRVKLEGKAKIQTVKVWYACTDDPHWRDLMWYSLDMFPRGDGYYERSFAGGTVDAFLIEVGDISQGVPGYVSSVPHKLTDAPVKPRRSRGSRPRLWDP
ncbi:MAG: PhoPQ-activated protein PqaA family protein [Planctomycetia bacterium]